MEYLKELQEAYKDVIINKNKIKGIQTEEDLHLILKSTQLSKDMRREIIEQWRNDPFHKLEKEFGKDVLNRVLQKKKEDICEEKINEILKNQSKEEQLQLLNRLINK